MRLLQINSVVNFGSTGKIAEDIGKLAMERGWESYIAFGRDSNESNSNTFRITSSFEIYEDVLATRLLDRHGLSHLRSTKRFIHGIQQLKPDVVHIHNLHGYYVNYSLLLRHLSEHRIPVVMTLHDCWTFTGHCCFFEFQGCDKWKSHCQSCPQLAEYPASWGIDRSSENFALKKEVFSKMNNLQLITVSDWLENLVRQSFLSSSKVSTIHNGIDTQLFKYSHLGHQNLRKEYGLADKWIILGVASVWDQRKGLKDFVQLSGRLDKSHQIVLVGITKDQRSQLPSSIIAIERTSSATGLASWYSCADVFVNPTHDDNFPTTNIEALACGTPVVTYDTGGSPEAIDSLTGIKVERGNVEKLAEAICTVRLNGKMAYHDSCIKRAHMHFDKNKNFNLYFDIYNSMV